jgi:hypothetical protein
MSMSSVLEGPLPSLPAHATLPLQAGPALTIPQGRGVWAALAERSLPEF